MKSIKFLLVFLVVLILVNCVARPNPNGGADGSAGFFMGLWHGFIILFTFIISLFSDGVTIYEVNNNGGWYNFGFLFGVMCFWGGGGNQTCAQVSKKKMKVHAETEDE